MTMIGKHIRHKIQLDGEGIYVAVILLLAHITVVISLWNIDVISNIEMNILVAPVPPLVGLLGWLHSQGERYSTQVPENRKLAYNIALFSAIVISAIIILFSWSLGT